MNKSFGFENDWQSSQNWASDAVLDQYIGTLLSKADDVQAIREFVKNQHKIGFAAGRSSIQSRIKDALEL